MSMNDVFPGQVIRIPKQVRRLSVVKKAMDDPVPPILESKEFLWMCFETNSCMLKKD
jgi:hypothetical protein